MSEPVAVPFLDLAAENAPLHAEVREAFERVLARNEFVLGQEVGFFEREVAAYVGAKYAVGVSSGSDALLVSMMALGVGPGDEVITSAFAPIAVAGAVARLGARPVFVDIDPTTYTLDPGAVGAALTERTCAIVASHLFGQPCDMGSLRPISAAFGVPLVEDATDAIGAHHALGPIGALGELAGFSFHPSRNLGAFGEGGLVTTNDHEHAENLRQLRAHGASFDGEHAMIGGNFRLDALQAAVLRVKLPHLTRWTESRRKNAALYDLLFLEEDIPEGVFLAPKRVEAGHVWSAYVIRVRDRDRVREQLAERGIGSEVQYARPVHLEPCFDSLGQGEGSFPEAEAAAREVLSLPIHASLEQGSIERVVSELTDLLRESA